jgi:hypothetical protein
MDILTTLLVYTINFTLPLNLLILQQSKDSENGEVTAFIHYKCFLSKANYLSHFSLNSIIHSFYF